MATDHADDPLGALLAVQHGMVSRRQCRDLGLTDAAIRALLRAWRWRRTLPRVYASFTGPLPFLSRCWAGLLYAGEGAVLSHETAAAVDGWLPVPKVIHLLVPHRRIVRAQGGLSIERSRTLTALHVHPVATPPRTRVERTVLDVAAARPVLDDALGVLAAALRERITTERRLRRAIDDLHHLPGRHELLLALASVGAGVQSPLELAHVRIEREHGLPPCHRQVRQVFDGRICLLDALDDYGVVRELDGRLGHETGRFRDMRRDNANTVEGRAVLRFGFADLRRRPCEVARQEIALLRLRGWNGEPRRCGPSCALG